MDPDEYYDDDDDYDDDEDYEVKYHDITDKNDLAATLSTVMETPEVFHGTCVVATVNLQKTKVKDFGFQSCHYMMGEPSNFSDSPSFVFSSLWTNKEVGQKHSETYWDFIFDEDKSPWKCVLKGRELVRNSKGKLISIGLNNSDPISSQVAVNLLIASRIPYERPGCVRVFIKALEQGFTPYEALALMATVAFKEDSESLVPAPYATHYPFDRNVSWNKVRNCDPSYDMNKVFLRDNFTPCNSIWSCNPRDLSLEKHVLETVKYDGLFPKAFKVSNQTDYSNPGHFNQRSGYLTWDKVSSRAKEFFHEQLQKVA